MKIYREITVVRQNKRRRLHFCPPSPAQPGPSCFCGVRVNTAAGDGSHVSPSWVRSWGTRAGEIIPSFGQLADVPGE